MKLTKSVISLILVLIMAFTAVTPAFAENETDNKGKTSSVQLFDGSFTALTTKTFVSFIRVLRTVNNVLNGNFFFGKDGTFDAELNEDIIAVCKDVSENSCLDPAMVLTNLPDVTGFGKNVSKVFALDTEEFRNGLYEKRDQYFAEGESFKGNFCWLVGAYFSGIESAYVYLTDIDNADYSQVTLDVKYSDGTTEVFYPEIFINTETGECFGPDEQGMMRIGFCCDTKEQLVYAPMYCWMRSFGFCIEYDWLCYLLPVYRYNTRRFKFDYADKEWLIQIWKGNYLITNGGEVGMYNREPEKSGSFYNVVTDEERVNMTLNISHGDDELVNIDKTLHWWVNGFKIADRLYSPRSLDMKFSMELYDEEMVKAFCEAIDRNIHHDVIYTVDGCTVFVEWPNRF